MPVVIRPIPAAETRTIRQMILRPQQTPQEQVYPGDDAPDSFHAGAYLDGKLVGVATILHDPPPGDSDAHAWRLRGMATLPEVRRQGVGAQLVRACVAYVAAQGGTSLWCNGRISALGFYTALGFRPEGEEFVTASGPHSVFRRQIARDEK